MIVEELIRVRSVDKTEVNHNANVRDGERS